MLVCEGQNELWWGWVGDGCRVFGCWVLGMVLMSCASLKRMEPELLLEDKTWRSFDGKVMPWTLGGGEGAEGEKVKGVVITIHGLSGAASDFWMLDEEWPGHGLAVYGLQLRGQGHDPEVRKRGHVASSRLWQRDLLAFHRLVKERHVGRPVYWYAESLGTLIALHTVRDLMDGEGWEGMRPEGIVMSAPAVGLRMEASQLRMRMIYAMVRMFPWLRVSLSQMAGVDAEQIQVTAGSTHGGQMAVTPHYVSKFSLRLLGEVDGMMRSACKAARGLRVPVLVLASPHDVIASEEQVQVFFDSIGSEEKELHWYRQSYHLLLHDKEREQVMEDVTRWVLGRVEEDG